MKLKKILKISKILLNTVQAVKEHPRLFVVMEDTITDSACVIDVHLHKALMRVDKSRKKNKNK